MTKIKDLKDAAKPLTILKEKFDQTALDEFVEICAASNKYLRELARRLCNGNAGMTTSIWPKSLQAIAVAHFGIEWCDMFTEEGKHFQLIAKEIHNERAKQTMRTIKGPAITRAIATKLLSVCKDLDRHQGNLEITKVEGRPEFTVRYTTATKRKVMKIHYMRIGPNGMIEDEKQEAAPSAE